MSDVKRTAIMGFVRAALACAVLFGLSLSTEQEAGLVVLAESALVVATVVRNKA